jgi:hypothetical protein
MQPPSHDPEECLSLQDLCESAPSASSVPADANANDLGRAFGPYPNQSSFLLGDWYWNHGSQKSQKSFKELVDVVASPSFNPEDVKHTRWSAINKTLGLADFDDGEEEWEDEDAGWRRSPIAIDVPFHRQMKSSEGWRRHVIGHLYHRSLVSVIKEKLANPVDNRHFHYEPYGLFWKPTLESEETRVHGEIYTSSSFERAHRALQESPGEPGCQLPRCIVAIMFWSDETLLTSFGKTKLWPVYMFFGNESKYRRCKPSLNLCNHIAYFESVRHLPATNSFIRLTRMHQLPNAFKDFASVHVGGGPTNAFFTHCRREAFHAQWALLLDDDFVSAYKHGIVVGCVDGVMRRFYPRIFTYSADYPEK